MKKYYVQKLNNYSRECLKNRLNMKGVFILANTKTYKEVVKILLKNGYILERTTGSHEIYRNEESGIICPVKCTKKDIPSGTVGSIKRITGLGF